MRQVTLLLGALVLLVGGCGGGSDEEAVESTVKAYLDAFADGDGEGACSRLAGHAFEEVYLAVSSLELALELDDPSYVPKAPKIETMSREEARSAIINGCPDLVEQLQRLGREA